MTRTHLLPILATLLTGAALLSCSDSASNTPPKTAGGNSSQSASTDTVATSAAVWPAALVVPIASITATPAAIPATRESAKPGDTITIIGKIGGSKKPFVSGRAAFTIVDLALKSCDEIEDDMCAKPWDYCCEDKTNLRKHTAMIEVQDADGKPLSIDAQGQNGLEPLKVVVVEGTLVANDAGGACIVRADRIALRD